MTHWFTMRTWQGGRLPPFLSLPLSLSVVPPCARRHTHKKKQSCNSCAIKDKQAARTFASVKSTPVRLFHEGTPPSAQIHAATSHFSLSLCMPAGCDCTCLVPQPSLQLSSSSSSSPLHSSASLFTQLYFPCYLPPKSASLFFLLSLSLFFPSPHNVISLKP